MHWDGIYSNIPFRFVADATWLVRRFDDTTTGVVRAKAMYWWFVHLNIFLLTQFDDVDWIPTFDMVVTFNHKPETRLKGLMTPTSAAPDDTAL